MKFDGLCRKKVYNVLIQKADKNKEYNVKGKPGFVYNFLEDAEISLEGMAYVVTGTLGEMWPIPESRMSIYDIVSEERPGVFLASTKMSEELYEYKLIPACEQREITISNGSILHVNSPKSEHGDGDRLVRIVGSDDVWVVNGLVFDKTYELI